MNVKASNSSTIKFLKNYGSINVSFSVNQLQTNDTLKYLSQHEKSIKLNCFPNGHILVDLPSIRRRNSTWKVCRNYIDLERRIHVEIMTSIRRGNFDVDSAFKIDEISMSSPRGFFDVASTSNRCNFCTGCFHCIISSHFLLWEPILSYSGIVLSRCDFNNIDVIADIGTTGTVSFGNFWNNANK